MNTQELAQKLYQSYASKMDVLEPLPEVIDQWTWYEHKTVTLDRTKIRPKWHALTAAQQQVWLEVAQTAVEYCN